MANDTQRPESLPTTADNAENCVKCNKCGNTILVGQAQMSASDQVSCDVCGSTQTIGEGTLGNCAMGAASNEDY